MQYEAVREHFKKQPFIPLKVRTVGGQEYRVTSPENIVSRRVAVFLTERGIPDYIALEFIETITPLVTPPPGETSSETAA